MGNIRGILKGQYIKGLNNSFSIPKKIVSIVGTNGKGTTANLISKILRDNSHSVGLYTSPHLINYNERIDINGINIDDKVLKEYFSKKCWKIYMRRGGKRSTGGKGKGKETKEEGGKEVRTTNTKRRHGCNM